MNLISSIKSGTAIAVLAVALSGCATNGEQQTGFSNAVNNVGGALQGVADGVGSVVGGFMQPYRNGVQVTEEQMAQLTEGMDASKVEHIIGYPPEIEDSKSGEIWSYPYSEIPHFGQNINETTVVRFDTSGKLVKAYKTSSRKSSSGNPLLDAANGIN